MAPGFAQLASVVGCSKRLLHQMHSQATESAHTHRTIAILLECHARQWDDFAGVATQQLSETEDLIAGIMQQLSAAWH